MWKNNRFWERKKSGKNPLDFFKFENDYES